MMDHGRDRREPPPYRRLLPHSAGDTIADVARRMHDDQARCDERVGGARGCEMLEMLARFHGREPVIRADDIQYVHDPTTLRRMADCGILKR